MNVPKEVILDLLPVYLAGEASPATKRWLEEYLAQEPELTDQLRRLQAEGFHEAALPAAPPELELRSLQRTRRTMAQLRWLFGLGMAFTTIALSVAITLRPVFKVRLLLLSYPGQLAPCLVAGLACWTAYFLLRRRLRVGDSKREGGPGANVR